MRLLGSGCLVLALCLSGPFAQAQSRSTTFSLEYSVPAGCPERRAFVNSLLSRARGAHVQGELPEVALFVELSGDRELAPGTLVIKLVDGQESRREIPAAACAQVLSSMALIAAMILDGGGLDDPPPRAFPDQANDLGPPATPQLQPRAEQQLRTERIDTTTAMHRASLLLAARAGLGPQSGVAPAVVPRFFLGLGLSSDRSGYWAPAVELTASVAAGAREMPPYGDARFRLLALTLSGCPLRFALGNRVGLRPCLPLEFGALHGAGENTLAKRQQDMPWLGVGAGLRSEVILSRAWLLELEGSATLLARADRFIFEPNQVVHDVPRVVFGLRVGAAYLVR
ncbi:MAG TPA: hypothetical protein VG937_37860 [Polyangiaceae bacterium]|nr:hypothetical protein [Polyangiaceae bacterium]